MHHHTLFAAAAVGAASVAVAVAMAAAAAMTEASIVEVRAEGAAAPLPRGM